MSLRGPNPGENGFTLIELLVALAVTGLAATMLLAGLKVPLAFSQRSLASQSRLDEIASAQSLLRGAIEGLRPVARLDSSRPIVDVRGSQRDFAFFSKPFASQQPDQLKRFRLLLGASGDLNLYQANSLDDRIDLNARSLIGWQPIPLLRNVAQLTVSYFGADSVSGGRRWQSYWYDRPQPPDLVRIQVLFAEGDGRKWPDLILRPAATANTACRIDRVSGRCAAN